MSKRKILLIIPWLPYPITSGGHHALYSGIKAIAEDMDIFIAYEAWDDKEYRAAKEAFLKIMPTIHLLPLLHHIIDVSGQSFYQRITYRIKVSIWNLIPHHSKKQNISHISDLVKRWEETIKPQKKAWQDHISNIFSKYSFDLIQVEMPWFLSFIYNLPIETKKIFVHHELGFVKRELEKRYWGNNKYLNTYKDYIDQIEIGQLNLYDAIITLSQIDAKKLVEKGVSKPVFPSFAAIESLTPYNNETCDGKRLVFLGASDNRPNVVGLKWFLDNCWNALIDIDQTYHLYIIGKWDQELIVEFEKKYPQIKFLGYVKELQDILKGSIMIVPITIGSGIRIKILEACSKGVPFVSTSVGAEGIPVVDGVHCFIADNADSFIDGIIKIQDSGIQKKFAINSAIMIKENYSLNALRKNRKAIYEAILK